MRENIANKMGERTLGEKSQTATLFELLCLSFLNERETIQSRDRAENNFFFFNRKYEIYIRMYFSSKKKNKTEKDLSVF